MRRKIIAFATILLDLSGGSALAGHGKAGLWNTTSTVSIPMPQMSAADMAEMKKMGMTMPGPQTSSYPICMTQADVDANQPPMLGRANTGCTTHVLGNSASAMSADMVCNGTLKGRGHFQVAYAGPEHYSGTYTFKGTANGQPADLTTSFKGDWARADCGKVKPFPVQQR